MESNASFLKPKWHPSAPSSTVLTFSPPQIACLMLITYRKHTPRNEDSLQPTQHFPDLCHDLINLKSLSLVVDEVGANEKAKEISTTKETPILIRHQHQPWTVFILLRIASSWHLHHVAPGQDRISVSTFHTMPGQQCYYSLSVKIVIITDGECTSRLVAGWTGLAHTCLGHRSLNRQNAIQHTVLASYLPIYLLPSRRSSCFLLQRWFNGLGLTL